MRERCAARYPLLRFAVLRARSAVLPAIVILPLFAGCGDDSSGGDGVDAGADASDPYAAPLPRIVVDRNRDGVLSAADDGDDDSGTWNADNGAIFLANRDDDDEDGVVDGENSEVDGEADVLDLARIEITPWQLAPEDASATLYVDESALDHVRVFRARDGTYSEVPVPVTLGASSLRQGVSLGIEGTSLLEDSSWDGRVALTLEVRAGGEVRATDVATMRQAPVVVPWNSAPTLRVFASDVGFGGGGDDLLNAIAMATSDLGIVSRFIDATRADYLIQGIFVDQWTQDFFEIGAMYMPVEGGLHRLAVGFRLKPPYESGRFLESELAGPDFAVHYRFRDDYNPADDHAALDYGGNLEVVPPFEGYPAGRLLVGSTPERHPDPVYTAMLDAQYAQAPVLEIDTSWLVVGHADEGVSFVEDVTSERGWKVLLHSPREAWRMLQDLVDADAANADRVLFQGKYWLDFFGVEYPADITVGEILADADLAIAQDVAQAHADELRALLKAEIGLTDEDFVELPFLWETFASAPGGGLRHVAFSPGAVNLLTFDGVALVARPFGPIVDSEDPLETVVRERLEALGLSVQFVDVWDLYHRLEGEVHCGSNVDRSVPEGHRWWEMVR